MHAAPAIEVDCAVVGAGPAGSALAGQLAELGLTACIIERRATVEARGETLVPGILPLLRHLGLGEAALEPLNRTPTGTMLLWGGTAPRTIDAGDKPAFVVERARFDALLLENAVARGAALLRPATILRASRGTGGGWIIRARTPDGERLVRARMLAIAAGRRAGLGGRPRRHGPATLALCASLAGPEPAIAESRIEAGADGWIWAAPLADGSSCAAVFVDPADPDLAAGIATVLRSRLARSRSLRSLAARPLSSPLRACDASRVGSAVVVSDDTIRVGEACFATDPLSSQGVLRAIVSGCRARLRSTRCCGVRRMPTRPGSSAWRASRRHSRTMPSPPPPIIANRRRPLRRRSGSRARPGRPSPRRSVPIFPPRPSRSRSRSAPRSSRSRLRKARSSRDDRPCATPGSGGRWPSFATSRSAP